MNRNATFRHEVQFYSSDSVLLESFARFIRNALKSHTAVVVLATKSHRESLVQQLSGEDFDIDCAMQHGMYISLDGVEMLSTIMVNGIPDRLRFFEGLCGLIWGAAATIIRCSARACYLVEPCDEFSDPGHAAKSTGLSR